jgi:hypothetical protein
VRWEISPYLYASHTPVCAEEYYFEKKKNQITQYYKAAFQNKEAIFITQATTASFVMKCGTKGRNEDKRWGGGS